MAKPTHYREANTDSHTGKRPNEQALVKDSPGQRLDGNTKLLEVWKAKIRAYYIALKIFRAWDQRWERVVTAGSIPFQYAPMRKKKQSFQLKTDLLYFIISQRIR